jgi:hypothetical protein
MTAAKATREADKMSRETGKASKVIHTGNGHYMAVIIGSAQHITSASHN